MTDVLLDTLLDLLKLLPFLFLSFLIIELIEHKLGEKSKKMITKSGKVGPLIGGVLGTVPQCGFSTIATNLYITRVISLGTLISIYLSTSDEMLPLLIKGQVPFTEILKILGIKVLIGIIFGFIIDLLYRKKSNNTFSLCEDDDCDCEESIFKSSIKHTLKVLLWIGIISLALNLIIDKDSISHIFNGSKIFGPFLSSLVGLIPNCASSVAITELKVAGTLSWGTALAGLLTNSGISLLLLFKENKNLKENIMIIFIVYIIGVISGIVLNLIGL